ncbi:MAG TPA: TrkH family potassium uptake protein [Treponemataceae bacterium]|nr:TrkH family potassium uptake protein [Treponemataceae bacterium]
MEARALFRAISVLLSIVALFMLACMLAGIFMGEATATIDIFTIPVVAGAFLFVLSLIVSSKSVELSQRSGYLFVVLSWIAAALLGAIPFYLAGFSLTPADAFFESMSGFTTTGSTILTDIEALPRSLLLWRATTHWLGGMGIVVLTVAVFPLLGISGRTLMEAEAPGPQVDKFTPRLSHTASILWLIYLCLTVILTILLMIGGMSWFDAVTHAFATMATGGFSTRNASVGAFDSAFIQIVITIFMILAGTGFTIHWRMLTGKRKEALKDHEWRTYIGIFAVSSILIWITLVRLGPDRLWTENLRHACFQVASILTTTGFATEDYLFWPAFAQTVLFTLMFIGGCAGSTAGGIKVGRAYTLFKMALSEMKYLLNPHAVYGIFVSGKYMHKKIVYDIAAMVYLFLGTALASTLVVSSAGYDILTSLTATLAAQGNIGPGFSLVGPALNYAFFPGWIKCWLSFIMLVGRLEVYTVLVLLTRAFWKR